MGRMLAVGIVLSMSLTASASPRLTGAPVAHSTTISIPLGGEAVLAFDVTHDGFFTINSIEVISAMGAPDNQLIVECFCGRDSCSCSASFVADSNEPGEWVIGFTAFDPATGLTSEQGTITVAIGGGVPRSPERILVEIRFVLARAQAGELILAGIDRSLSAKVQELGKFLEQDSMEPVFRVRHAFIHEVQAQLGKNIDSEVAEELVVLADQFGQATNDPCPGVFCLIHNVSGPSATADAVYVAQSGAVHVEGTVQVQGNGVHFWDVALTLSVVAEVTTDGVSSVMSFPFSGHRELAHGRFPHNCRFNERLIDYQESVTLGTEADIENEILDQLTNQFGANVQVDQFGAPTAVTIDATIEMTCVGIGAPLGVPEVFRGTLFLGADGDGGPIDLLKISGP